VAREVWEQTGSVIFPNFLATHERVSSLSGSLVEVLGESGFSRQVEVDETTMEMEMENEMKRVKLKLKLE
jgi:uncharacterized protein YqgV (UPF0045/DUF77 family)